MPRAVLGLLVPLAALAVPGAAGAQSSRPDTTRIAVRAVDTVRVGCSGGYTGAGSGNLITSDGQLTRYSKPLRSPATHTLLRRDSVAAASVFAHLARIRFRAIAHKEIGNMTCVLELHDRAGEHEVYWTGKAPAALEPVLAALDRVFGDDRRWLR